MKTYTVSIVGCGSIGALKDNQFDSPGSDAILTHAHAFYEHSRTELSYFVDVDLNKQQCAETKWGLPHRTVGGLVPNTDIIVIASPTNTHYQNLMIALATLKPKLVIAEKPFCSTLKEAKEVHDAYTLAGIPILVNYSRRFEHFHSAIFTDLRAGAYGEIYHARCLYGRGLKRDGCHGLDIFNMVFGDPVGLQYNHRGIADGEPNDPTFTVHLEYEKCKEVYMVGCDSRAWGAFEIEFVTEKGIIRFPGWGKYIQYFQAEDETTFGQYKALSATAAKYATGLNKMMLYMADNCVRFLDGGEDLACTSADAIKVHEILNYTNLLKDGAVLPPRKEI